MAKSENLQTELRELQERIATLDAALTTKPGAGLGQGSTEETQWERDRALVERLREQVHRIERTLTDMERHRYGICSVCGEAIHPDRLAVLPDTRLCIQCARKTRRTGSRGRWLDTEKDGFDVPQDIGS